MADDLRFVRDRSDVPARIIRFDTRNMDRALAPKSVDAVITSPPYPNEKDYTRTTRLESVILGLITNRRELRQVKEALLRSNTRGVYKNDSDDLAVANFRSIGDIADAIEHRRVELGKTSGFERLYAKVTRLYFGGMSKHLSSLKTVLRPGAQLAYVVGDQASFLRVMIPTGQIIADIAESLGYRVTGIDLSVLDFPPLLVSIYGRRLFLWSGQTTSNEVSQMPEPGRYEQILTKVFFDKYVDDSRQVEFTRQDLIDATEELGIERPLNMGDIPYSFRYRGLSPPEIMATAPDGETWIWRSVGRSIYRLVLVPDRPILPNPDLALTKVPDATPGIVAWHSESDEQSLLARLRYNRLIDVFLGITCYSLQNHLRTTVEEIGQVETDEIYVGIDRRGSHYIIPVQAKSERDQIGRVQLEQDIALCKQKWDSLICRPVAAQVMRNDAIALFEFELQDDEVRIVSERHYQLVEQDQMTVEDCKGIGNVLWTNQGHMQ